MATRNSQVTQGWTLEYIGLTLIISILTGFLGFFVNYFLTQRTALKRKVLVVSPDARNAIPAPESLAPMLAKFSLRSNPMVEIKSYFTYEVTLKNDGGEGLEGAELFVYPPDGITLIKKPNIATKPKGLEDAMKLSQDAVPEKPEVDKWRIGLLDKNWTISLGYYGYSPDYQATSRLKVVIAKKDWSPRYEEIEPAEMPPVFLQPKLFLPVIGMVAVLVALRIWLSLFQRRRYREELKRMAFAEERYFHMLERQRLRDKFREQDPGVKTPDSEDR